MKVFSRTTPNRSERIGTPLYFAMHVTEGAFDGAVSWLCNPAVDGSADEVVNISGSRVAVLNTIRSGMKSWAVGNGNSVSVSWENEGYSGQTHWPDSHYLTVAHRLVAAQKAVRSKYGRTIPLRRTTTKGVPGICGHGDLAHWYGGSDHYGCPGPTFNFNRLVGKCALIQAPADTSRKAQWAWARWYTGLGEYKGHKQAPKRRPNVPLRIPRTWWLKVVWYQKNVIAARAKAKARRGK